MKSDRPDDDARRIVDPEDPSAALAKLHRRARVEGDRALLEPLLTLGLETPEPLLEAAARVIADRLQPAIELLGVMSYEALRADRRAPPGRLIQTQIAVFRHRRTDMELALIPGLPSSTETTEEDTSADQASSLFFIGRHPVTRRALPLMRPTGAAGDEDASGSEATGLDEDRPVTGLTVAAMTALCRHAGLRLPSLAEWRHACAGASGALHWWCVDYEPGLHCTWSRANGHRGAEDMRRLEPQSPALHDRPGARNAFGLVDMVGNVHEACRGHDRDPEAWSACGLSVLMPPASGYDLLHPPILGPDDADIDLGFRVAMDLPL